MRWLGGGPIIRLPKTQFPLPLMNKDFGLIVNVARDVHALMPATLATFLINSEAHTLNRGKVMCHPFQKQVGVE